MARLAQLINNADKHREVAYKKALKLVESHLSAIHKTMEFAARNSGYSGFDSAINSIRRSDFEAVYLQLYEKVGRYIADADYAAYNLHLKRAGFSFVDAVWRSYLERAMGNPIIASFITKVTDTTRKLYRDILQEAAAQNLAPLEIARLLVSKRATLIKARSLTIARTESGYAASIGTEFAADRIESEIGVQMYTVWNHYPHKDPRETHIALNKHFVKRGEAFNVDGIFMKYPHDPAGGASNNVNCGCNHVYATEDVLKEIGLWRGV